MNYTFTEHDVIRLAYNECTPIEKSLIEAEINHNPDFLSLYKQVVQMKARMEKFRENANPSSIELVLEYSHSLTGLEEASSR